MGSYTDDFLRMLRNQVNIDRVIDRLMIDTRKGKDLRRFRCPLCDRFHTATNPKTNLGRCFECQKNFNPIDLVMRLAPWGRATATCRNIEKRGLKTPLFRP